jgi:hypothetical protein
MHRAATARDRHDLIFFYELPGMLREAAYYPHKIKWYLTLSFSIKNTKKRLLTRALIIVIIGVLENTAWIKF